MINGYFLLTILRNKRMLNIENIIIKTKNFIICTIKNPHIDREEGGHVVVASNTDKYTTIEEMPRDILHELIDIASICGKYIKSMFANESIDIGIINYQVNGNWSALNNVRDPVHMHLYGRAKHSKNQLYGSALFLPDFETGFYDHNQGLPMSDIIYLREKLLHDEIIKKYLPVEHLIDQDKLKG